MVRGLTGLALLLFVSGSNAQLNLRHIQYTNDLTHAWVDDVATESFHTGESIVFDLWTFRKGSPVDLSDASAVVWELVERSTGTDLLYLVQTGAVYNATNGHSRFTVSPADSVVPPGTYESVVRAWTSETGAVQRAGVLARQRFEVLWNVTTNAAYVGPLTNGTILSSGNVTILDPLNFPWWVPGQPADGSTFTNLPDSGSSEHTHQVTSADIVDGSIDSADIGAGVLELTHLAPEIRDEFVNRSGDTMTGPITGTTMRMSGNIRGSAVIADTSLDAPNVESGAFGWGF